MYQTKLEQFEGPLDLLLQLIEKQELDISRVSLSQLTDQFIDYLHRGENISMDELADFLVIAAKLLFIKSRTLFPNLGLKDEEGMSLESQLKIYKEYWEAAKEISALIRQKWFVFFREKMAIEPAFRPPPKLKTEKLKLAFEAIIKGFEPFVKIPQKLVLAKISLEEKIKYLKDLILKKASLSFGGLVAAKDRAETIIHFLALLELIKQQVVIFEQKGIFSDILVKKV